MPAPGPGEGRRGEGLQWLVNPERTGGGELYPEELARLLGPEDAEAAGREIAGWPGYRATPLHSLPALAGKAGVGRVWYKDEASRFGLGSFKALGGAYALYRVLARRVREERGRLPSSRELMEGCHADLVRDVTATCASEGNHGRSVAWGAQMFGCRCVIYLPEEVSPRRERAIRSHGAEVVRVAGGYDRAVRQADETAREEGREVISDTGYPGYREVPLDVMAGYTLLVREALDQAGWEQGEPLPFTHAFVPAGVGGLAAAVCAALWQAAGGKRPEVAVVEALGAEALLRSAAAGERVTLDGPFGTWMGGLACGTPSLAAWPFVRRAARAFVAVSDRREAQAMRRLAEGAGEDPPLVAGESGAAGVAGLLAARESALGAALGLGPESRVLVVGTEGATDPDAYRQIVGRGPEEVGGQVPPNEARGPNQ